MKRVSLRSAILQVVCRHRYGAHVVNAPKDPPSEAFLFEGVAVGRRTFLFDGNGDGRTNFHGGGIYPEVSEYRRVGGKDHK